LVIRAEKGTGDTFKSPFEKDSRSQLHAAVDGAQMTVHLSNGAVELNRHVLEEATGRQNLVEEGGRML
jgi:hypothetical protein